ncbi:DNA-directed RNA polymerase subunit D [Candidatus Micrarchaeota archaeon]|nr:MAG: DNA-directed RNA polymerase subunit D [Candidatus Micrarchaeota archaeon]
MKIEILESKGNTMRFILSNAPLSLANALRKTLLTEIPCLAIHEVDIFENSSVVFDEYIAHRLGQIPLITPKTYIQSPREVIFSLEAEGPKMVYTKDLKSSDPKVKPVYDNMPLIQLGRGQRIRLEAKAVIGRAKDHAKWQACIVHYIMKPEIKIRQSKIKDPKICAQACPRKILKVSKGKLEVTDETKCISCMECVKACGEDAIEVKHSNKDFIFTVESFGNMKVKELLNEAFNVLSQKLDDFSKELKSCGDAGARSNGQG